MRERARQRWPHDTFLPISIDIAKDAFALLRKKTLDALKETQLLTSRDNCWYREHAHIWMYHPSNNYNVADQSVWPHTRCVKCAYSDVRDRLDTVMDVMSMYRTALAYALDCSYESLRQALYDSGQEKHWKRGAFSVRLYRRVPRMLSSEDSMTLVRDMADESARQIGYVPARYRRTKRRRINA
jgi:hypothetical protein